MDNMTTIRVSCPACGSVDLTPAQIRLTVVQMPDEPVGPDSHYAFLCPSCADRVEKPADERIARLLSTGGVEVEVLDLDDLHDLHPSSTPRHPEDPPSGPSFDHDDLLDLHLLLESDDWYAQLEALTGR